MHRNAICYLILIILLVACAPAATSIPVVIPSPTASLTAVPTLESSSATAVPHVTVTITPSCKPSQKTSLKIMPLGDSITYGDGIRSYGGYRNLLGALLRSDGYPFDFVGSQKSGGDISTLG